MRAWMLFLLLAGVFNLACAEEFSAKVIAVLDGDTVLVLRGKQQIKIRLVNIDAPEKVQDFGAASRQSLAEMVLRMQVKVNSKAMDDYGRMVAQLEVGGLNVNEEQVRRGLAWEYSHFHRDRRYLTLQSEARQAKRGLWTQLEPVPPWQWRKAQPTAQPPQPRAAQTNNCGDKRLCPQMSSCDEARLYFTQCGMKLLDGNGDGVPCESLCVVSTMVESHSGSGKLSVP